ncbi:hypothetical protein H4R27_006451, partial [Coemansia aciculifera]
MAAGGRPVLDSHHYKHCEPSLNSSNAISEAANEESIIIAVIQAMILHNALVTD